MNSSVSIIAGASVAAVSTIAMGVHAMIEPASSFYGKVHWRGDPAAANSRVALTFDDGPTDPSTSAILDTLGEFDAKATFFVIGQNVEKTPKLIERMHAEGHIVANHSYDHPWFGMMRGPWYWQEQIVRTDGLIEQIIGCRPAMFRPPLGVKTWFIHRPSQKTGHSMITWSRRARDGVATTAESILDRLIPQSAAGDILLLHDGIEPHHPRDTSASVKVIRPLIIRLREQNLQPVRVDELLGLNAYSRLVAHE